MLRQSTQNDVCTVQRYQILVQHFKCFPPTPVAVSLLTNNKDSTPSRAALVTDHTLATRKKWVCHVVPTVTEPTVHTQFGHQVLGLCRQEVTSPTCNAMATCILFLQTCFLLTLWVSEEFKAERGDPLKAEAELWKPRPKQDASTGVRPCLPLPSLGSN